MQIRHLALAAGLLLTSAGVAAAAPALVTGDLNLRRGPGTNFGVITVLPGGSTVNVLNCDGGWCRVAWPGAAGFASSGYLDIGRRAYGAVPPPVYAPPPVVSFRFGYGSPRWRDHRDWRRHRDGGRRSGRWHHRRYR